MPFKGFSYIADIRETLWQIAGIIWYYSEKTAEKMTPPRGAGTLYADYGWNRFHSILPHRAHC